MYVPRKYDWLAPVGVIAASFATYQKYTSWDTALLVNVPAVFISCCWSVYLWQAGVAYQNWETRDEDSEARHAADGAARAWALDHPEQTTSGNTPVLVPIAGYKHPVEPQPKNDPLWRRMLKREKVKPTASHPAMVVNRYTAEVVDFDVTKIDIRNICRRQLTYRNHAELGRQDGDYREEIWVKSGEMSRRRLTAALKTLEYAEGIARKGSAKNSPYITIDWRVIEMGARGKPLPQPPELS